ncbi:hypothetical protein ACCO45_003919 [Purpureocillium lilacinum]|uniref:Uncharacterized protein n=1 Tax=Purpureocillium lilacinum TaxID=33203 RepID=A0ACC4E421_PURLI
MASLGALTFLSRSSRKFYKHGGPYLGIPQRYVTTTDSLPPHFHPANALHCNEFRLSVPGLKHPTKRCPSTQHVLPLHLLERLPRVLHHVQQATQSRPLLERRHCLAPLLVLVLVLVLIVLVVVHHPAPPQGRPPRPAPPRPPLPQRPLRRVRVRDVHRPKPCGACAARIAWNNTRDIGRARREQQQQIQNNHQQDHQQGRERGPQQEQQEERVVELASYGGGLGAGTDRMPLGHVELRLAHVDYVVPQVKAEYGVSRGGAAAGGRLPAVVDRGVWDEPAQEVVKSRPRGENGMG